MTHGEPPTADIGTVVDWLEDRLDAEMAARLERLVATGDPEVLTTVAWCRRFTATARMPTEPVSAVLAARLRAMGPTSMADSPMDPSSWLNRFMGVVQATLSFDSFQAPGLAMARSSSDATRQLVFAAPGLDVAVDLSQRSGDQLVATAQLLPIDDAAAAAAVLVQTWSRFGMVGEERSDALGRVELGALPADVVVVVIDSTSFWPALQAELDLRGHI